MNHSVGQVSAVELKARFDEGERLALLDVREEDERMYASITCPAGVIDLHVPVGEVARRYEEIEVSTQGRPLVVYCHHGQRSMVVASWLVRRGMGEVMNLEDGIDGWSVRVDPEIPRY